MRVCVCVQEVLLPATIALLCMNHPVHMQEALRRYLLLSQSSLAVPDKELEVPAGAEAAVALCINIVHEPSGAHAGNSAPLPAAVAVFSGCA